MKRLLPALILALSLPAWGATATRVSSFDYDAVTGLLVKETIEPDQPQNRLDTTYTHDAFGNRKSATVSSPATGTAAIVARTTSTTYDANGQFPTVTSNALAHSETKTFDPRFGTVASLTGPNGLVTGWQYDGFGRKTRETRADGTYTAWSYLPCDAACPAYGAYRMVTQAFAPGNVQSAPVTTTYYDALNREVRSATQSFNGTWIYKDTVYDNQGRVQKVSRPYFVGQTIYWITSEYDELGRVVKVTEPDDLDHPVLIVVYNGLVTSRTNRKGQTTSETRNVLGQKTAVTDALGNLTSYAYDAFGSLATVTAPGGIVTTNLYDIRGRKTQTTDPDLGLWRYEYNALGELVKQTDAKAQITTMVYDKLGRMTSRVEPGLTSTWVWDTASKGKGKLTSASTSAGYIRSHVYDTLGRPNTTISNHGAGNPLLISSATYDAAGRAATSTYPNGLVVKQVYNALGYLAEVRNNATNALYWQANAMDAEGHLTQETYGNGTVTQRGYDPLTGRLQNITGYKGATQIQGHAYVYDTIGNVAILADGPGSQLEIRGGYDALNRLTNADIYINGVATAQNLTYNALGNITSKTGVGTYAYGNALHKHAVTAVTGGPVNLSYVYDANGNLTSGGGRSITWTAWNMPASLTQSGQTQSWSYSPEHDRYKMVTTGRTTWYLNPSIHQGGHYERTQYTSGTIEHRVTLYGGGRAIGEVLTFDGGAPSQTRYFHSDQQGSIAAVTDSAGAVLTRFRYDPWGKQTLVSGSNTGIDATRQGHTSHEMLDGGLTHMNGRLYDPVLSRFVSADPTVDNPFDLQSLNRYSYVNNNPLGFTDPSGYFKIFGKKWSWWRDTVVKPVVAAWLAPYAFNIGFWGVGTAVGGGAFGGVAGTLAGASLAGATVSLINQGNLNGWQYNALGAALFSGAGDIGVAFGEGGVAHYASHAAAGCISASASGGDCGRGAASGVAGLYGTNYGAIGAVVAGGTASALGGGKFANGATTAAFGYLFNFMMHKREVRTYDVLTKEIEAHNRYVLSFSPLSNSDSGFSSFFGLVDEYASTALRGVGKYVYKVIDALVPTGYGTHDLNGLGTKWDAYKLEGQLKTLAATQRLDLGPGGISADQAKAFLGAAQKIPGFTETYGTTREFLRQVDQ